MVASPTGPWEADTGPPQPVVKMEPTTFRTVTLRTANIIGPQPGGQAIRVVGTARYERRVLVLNLDVGTSKFLSPSANEFNLLGQVGPPAGSFVLPDGSPTEFAVDPKQTLFAAGDGGATPQTLSVSISQDIPAPTGPRPIGYRAAPTAFRTFTLNPTGTPNAAIRIAPAACKPQRVVVVAEATATNIRVTSSPADLEAFGTTPAGAFTLNAVAGPITFVLAPDQPLFASVDPLSPVNRLAVSVSEIDVYAVRGPTGIPGPGATE